MKELLIKILKPVLFIAFDLMLFITLLFTALQVVVYNDSYFKWHYETHQIVESTGMDINNLMSVTDKMMDYLIDKRDSLDMTAPVNGITEEVFGDREKAHMADVKVLFLQGKQLRDLSSITLALGLLFLFVSKRAILLSWLKQLKAFFISSFIVVGLFGALFASDFNKYFTLFHKMFFTNDLWLLDPNTDILINMVPEIFFFQTVMLIFALFVASICIILVGSHYILKKGNRKHKRKIVSEYRFKN